MYNVSEAGARLASTALLRNERDERLCFEVNWGLQPPERHILRFKKGSFIFVSFPTTAVTQ